MIDINLPRIKYLQTNIFSRDELWRDMYDRLYKELGGKMDCPAIRDKAHSIIFHTVQTLVQRGDINKDDQDDICVCLQAIWLSSVLGEM